MADELKTDETISTPTDSKDTTVTITQEKLDSLISEKFKKGATKANADLLESLGVESIDDIKKIMKAKADADEAAKTELEKAQEAVEALKSVNNELISKGAKLEETNRINALASLNEVKDVEYFAFKYAQAKTSEGFNEDTFLKDFKAGNPSVTPRTDASNNSNAPVNVDLRKMSIKQLKEYQATL